MHFNMILLFCVLAGGNFFGFGSSDAPAVLFARGGYDVTGIVLPPGDVNTSDKSGISGASSSSNVSSSSDTLGPSGSSGTARASLIGDATCEATLTFDNYTIADAQTVINVDALKSFTHPVDLPDPYSKGFRMKNWGLVTQVGGTPVYKPSSGSNVIGYGAVSVQYAGPAGMTISDRTIDRFAPLSFQFFCSLNQFVTNASDFLGVDCTLTTICHEGGGVKSYQKFYYAGSGVHNPLTMETAVFDVTGDTCACEAMSFRSLTTWKDVEKTLVARLGMDTGIAFVENLKAEKVSLADSFVAGLDTFKVLKFSGMDGRHQAVRNAAVLRGRSRDSLISTAVFCI